MKSKFSKKKNESILLLGHRGLIGSAILDQLKLRGYNKVLTVEKKKLNLLSISKLENFFKKERPKNIIIAAARVGGIYANNTYPFNFLYENLVIQNKEFQIFCKQLSLKNSKLWRKKKDFKKPVPKNFLEKVKKISGKMNLISHKY